MTVWTWLLGFISANIVGEQIYNEIEKNILTQKAYEYARKRGKPVLDFGCGFRPRGDYNVDIKPRTAKNFIQIHSFEKPLLPFPNKFFGSALALHVLEHTMNPENALAELHRVAEKVFAATPKPYWILTWLHPDHKHDVPEAALGDLQPADGVAAQIGIANKFVRADHKHMLGPMGADIDFNYYEADDFCLECRIDLTAPPAGVAAKEGRLGFYTYDDHPYVYVV